MNDRVASSAAAAVAAPKGKSHLFHGGFAGLLVTQFFGAMNDNILKQVLIFMAATGVWAGRLGDAGEAWIAMLFTLPFIFLSGWGGQVADRYSKQRVTRLLKVIEIPIVGLAMAGLWTKSLSLTIAALMALAIHSTFFGPSKYGMIPELVPGDQLSRANGTINMLTNMAAIAGTLAAGPLCDRYDPARLNPNSTIQPLLWLPGAAMLVVAVLGLISSFAIPRLKAADPNLHWQINPMATYVKAVIEMAQSPLLMVTLAWSYFYMLASTALLILPHYTDILHIDYTQNSYLLGALGVAIGLGSVLAGWISGRGIQPRLIPVGAAGMFIAFVMLGSLKPEYWAVMGLLMLAGVSAGFYIVPLQALLQKLSPDGERGRFIGTANAISFVAFTVGAGIEWASANVGRLQPNRIFLVVATLTLVGTCAMLWKMRNILRK